MGSPFMKKHLSRRELTRRMEQGREAMRVLGAVVHEAGGHIRIKRDTIPALPRDHSVTVVRDSLTGDLILTCPMPGRLATEELTFEQIRERYGKREEEVPEPAGAEERDGDGGVQPAPEEEEG